MKTHEELQAIVAFADALPVAVWVGRAPKGEVVYVNREFERILGITPPEGAGAGNYVGPYGVHALDGGPYPEDRMPWERVMRSKATEIIDDLVIHRHDGKKVYLRVFAKPLFDERGEVAYVVEAFTDRTREVEEEQRRIEGEQQVQGMRRLESIGSLAGGVAHDFNNLLAIVKLVAAQLRMGESDPDRLQLVRYLDDVADSAAKLTRALLGFARRGKLLARPVSMHDVAGSVVELARRTFDRRVEIVADFGAQPDVVVGDAAQLEQVVMNLVMNARDATPAGRITVRTRSAAVGPGHAVLAPGPYVVLEVEDTGVGIDPAVRERVFEPYVSTKATGAGKGTGLGLATVYGVARAHGGAAEIAATSTTGRTGTTMRAWFPSSDAAVEKTPAPSPRPVRGTGTILVVDDEPLVLRMTRRALESVGYDVLEAGSGEEAIAAYRAAPKVDAVVLDMVMPGMDGGELFLALRAIDPDVRALLTTGCALNHEAQRILDLGVRGFLAKPFDGAELSVALAGVLAD